MRDERVWVQQARTEFAKHRATAERALAQVGDDAFFLVPHPESNSLALIVKHVAGNLRSRWTDAWTSDGEKPDRDRDGEFERREDDTRPALMAAWARGFDAVDEALGGLQPAEYALPLVIRGEPLALEAAVLRSLTHTAGHVGQIVWLAKFLAGQAWQTLSIPRGASGTFRP